MDDPAKLQSLIDEVAAQVISKIGSDAFEDNNTEDAVLVFYPQFVSQPELLTDYIKKTYQNVRYLFPKGLQLSGQNIQGLQIEDDGVGQQIMASLGSYQSIVLAFPSVNVLKKITAGDDDGFTEAVVTKAILRNINVVLLLDFTLQATSQSKWLKSIYSSIKDIEEAGAEVVTLTCTREDRINALELVTEADVVRICDSGSRMIKCKGDAVVTPLAWDKANELGLIIEMLKEQ